MLSELYKNAQKYKMRKRTLEKTNKKYIKQYTIYCVTFYSV